MVGDAIEEGHFNIPNADGLHQFKTQLIVCPNSKCRKFALTLLAYGLEIASSGVSKVTGPIKTWRLIISGLKFMKARTIERFAAAQAKVIELLWERCAYLEKIIKSDAVLIKLYQEAEKSPDEIIGALTQSKYVN